MSDHPTDLESSIIRTLCWFSVFDYPLSAFEIWKWLLEPDRTYDLSQVYRVLDESLWLSERLESYSGLYVLRGRDAGASFLQRQLRFLDSVRKLLKLRRVGSFFHMLPGARAVGAVNTLAFFNTTETSDIDLFIITKPGFLWSTRFFLVLPFALLGKRPNLSHGSAIRDPFCFSFFITTESAQLEAVKRESVDHYLAFWVKSIIPVFDKGNQFGQFERTNAWTSTILPNARARSRHNVHAPIRLPSLPIQSRAFEGVFRSVQRSRLPASIVELANVDTRVVVTDHMLKFHENDRREQFESAYSEALARHL